GWGSASASGNPDNLLTASATLNMGETGVLRAPISHSYSPEATASWNNDAVIVHAPPGVSLPNSARLQFKVDLLPDAQRQEGAMNVAVLQINGHMIVVDWNGSTDLKFHPTLPYPGTGGGSDQQHYTATFNINLALHPDGVSDPFSLSLQTGRSIQPNTMFNWYSGDSVSLSLTGVTLPDGTPLTAAGY